MAKEILKKKLDQMVGIVHELEIWLAPSLDYFKNNAMAMRATERNFQLLVDYACDINGQIILEHDMPAPDTYKQSFIAMGKIGIVPSALADILAEGARLRNILVYEYDFIENDEKFYHSAKKLLPAYTQYIEIIYSFLRK